MTLGKKIAQYRRQQNITQETLATQLGVSNQAVSKWEAEQCCPDIQLLPKIADIFEVTLDELFDREPKQIPKSDLPWEDDGKLRAVLFAGTKLIAGHSAAQSIQFQYEGPALNVESAFSVTCGDVEGNIHASGDVDCGDVEGSVSAGGDVDCGDVEGNVNARADVDCGDVAGNVVAGADIDCGDIEGNAAAGRDLNCEDIGGSAVAGGSIQY